MIGKGDYENLISSLSIGSSVAEKDDFLEDAKIETPIFNDFVQDKVDLILGTKGSGKTSLFILTYAIKDFLFEQQRIHIVTGVEPQGNAVFESFKNYFNTFSENDFENFWKIYFIHLIYSDFFLDTKFDKLHSIISNEFSEFTKECAEIGIPEIKKSLDFKGLVSKSLDALRAIKKIKGGLDIDIEKPSQMTPHLELEFYDKKSDDQVPLYVNRVGILLEKILQKINYRVWILLDRLDVVFEHGSNLEFLALRGLLKAYESFQVQAGRAPKYLRIKIFLRNDIFDFLTNPGQFIKISDRQGAKLSALTHIVARSTKTPLRWTKEQIQQLILKRLFLSTFFQNYYAISLSNLDTEKTRRELWDKIFGEKIEQGEKKPDSLSWIYTRLSDSQQVTPRSAIDFMEGVIHEQQKLFKLNKVDQDRIFSPQAIKHGIVTASNQKYTSETRNEYSKIIEYIEKLKGGRATFTSKSLELLFGEEYNQIIQELEKIGILSKSRGGDYKVSFIFRAALNIHPQF